MSVLRFTLDPESRRTFCDKYSLVVTLVHRCEAPLPNINLPNYDIWRQLLLLNLFAFCIRSFAFSWVRIRSHRRA